MGYYAVSNAERNLSTNGKRLDKVTHFDWVKYTPIAMAISRRTTANGFRPPLDFTSAALTLDAEDFLAELGFTFNVPMRNSFIFFLASEE